MTSRSAAATAIVGRPPNRRGSPGRDARQLPPDRVPPRIALRTRRIGGWIAETSAAGQKYEGFQFYYAGGTDVRPSLEGDTCFDQRTIRAGHDRAWVHSGRARQGGFFFHSRCKTPFDGCAKERREHSKRGGSQGPRGARRQAGLEYLCGRSRLLFLFRESPGARLKRSRVACARLARRTAAMVPPT